MKSLANRCFDCRPTSLRPFALISLVAAVGVLVLSGCVGKGATKITADTSCKDYLAQPAEVRHDAAVRISTQIEGLSSPGNPMWGFTLDNACGSSSPDKTIGQLWRHE